MTEKKQAEVRPFHEKFAAKTDHKGDPLPGEAERVAKEIADENSRKGAASPPTPPRRP